VVGSIDDGPDAWKRVVGGDGGYVAVDPNDPSSIYAEYQFANFYVSRNGGATWGPMILGLSDQFLFITPFTLDPNLTSRLWLGGRSMWRNDTGIWRRASATLPGLVSAMAVAPGDSNRVLAGTNEGSIARTSSATIDSATSVWSLVKPRDGFVTSLTFDPHDANVVWATYAGFGGSHVYRSADGGATWQPRDGNLPDIPVHSVAIDPVHSGRLYLGTDLGVFVSSDHGSSWSVENTGFAAVVTEAVVIGPGQFGPAVYAFTHGRGAWRAELVQPGVRRRSVR
jgi:hypothetical protein